MRFSPASWAIRQFGGASVLARAVGCQRHDVSHWKAAERIPSRRLPAVLEAAKQRGLDVTAEDLIRGRETLQ